MKKLILAIDDNRDFLKILEDMLKENGYRVETLDDPVKAEEVIDKVDPDLLLIDILMPGRSGFNLIEDFKEKGLYEDIPKVFLTCLDDDIERMTAIAHGITRYITKPCDPKELLDLIKNVLEEEEVSK